MYSELCNCNIAAYGLQARTRLHIFFSLVLLLSQNCEVYALSTCTLLWMMLNAVLMLNPLGNCRPMMSKPVVSVVATVHHNIIGRECPGVRVVLSCIHQDKTILGSNV